MNNPSEQNHVSQVSRATGTIMVAFILSQLVGLVRRVMVANAFGASAELDAFIATNRVSETLFNLIAGGALGSAFIPAFTTLLAKKNKIAAWKLASATANLIFIILTVLGIMAFIFAPQIVRYALAPGLTRDASLFQLAINLLRIQLVSAILFGLSGLVMGILNSHQVFLIPALTPAMYQIGMIIGVIFLCPSMGVIGLAWGVVLGAFLHLLLQLPILIKQKGEYSLTVGWKNQDLHEVLRLMLPRLLGVAVVQVNFWVNSWLASKMSPGSLVGVDFGFSLMLMAQATIGQSVATALMPSLSTNYALGKMDEFRHTLFSSVRGIFFLSAPAAIGLIILRNPIVAMLYQRGSFTSQSTELVSWALLFYSLGLVGHTLLEILARSFYAMHDTRTPVQIGIGAMIFNIILSVVFSKLFSLMNLMPHGGLALANSLATSLEAVILYLLMTRRIGSAKKTFLAKGLFQSIVASIVMGLVLSFWLWLTIKNPVWFRTLGGLLISLVILGITLWIFQVPEILQFIQVVKAKFSKEN